MFEYERSLDEAIPADLLPSIKHIRREFDDAHWSCERTTLRFCYGRLHGEQVEDPTNDYFKCLMHIKAKVGPFATQNFHDLLNAGTEPALFKAFYDLLRESMSVTALHLFGDLTEIARGKEHRLSSPPLEWAEAQMQNIIRYHKHRIRTWVRSVCDKQPYDPTDESDEIFFWRKWQAPNFVVMTPSRSQPYDGNTTWERNDPEKSSRWLDLFADDYVAHIEMELRKAAGEAAVALAKRATSTSTDPQASDSQQYTRLAAERPLQQSPARPSLESGRKPSSVRLEVRKLDTEAKYKHWQKAYKASMKRSPGKSDSWHAYQIAKRPIAEGSSPETIRKHMKK